MLQLDEKERFQDVLEVFEVYFNKKKSKQLSPDNLTLAERNFFPTLTENHVNLVCRALFQLVFIFLCLKQPRCELIIKFYYYFIFILRIALSQWKSFQIFASSWTHLISNCRLCL